MIRRRRKIREIPFSFDSFLDIVANVVGIIIRLILVVWVGARSYSSLQYATKTEAGTSAVSPAQEITDPLEEELARQRSGLEGSRQRLLEQLRQLGRLEKDELQLKGELATLDARAASLTLEQQDLAKTFATRETIVKQAALSEAELRRRSKDLDEEIRRLAQMEPPKKLLHYRTPVSRTVQSEELFFECKKGHVTFIDISALLLEVRRRNEENANLLRTTWQASDVIPAVGAFQLRYTLERERDILDAMSSTARPEASGTFRYGLSEWQIEPVAPTRGETGDAALAPGSEFRQAVDGVDPQLTTITFWVYPDSFELFRRLRDYLYEREVMVAGRPLPDGVPIASSRRGTASRGQ
jgi:hypothetical protein